MANKLTHDQKQKIIYLYSKGWTRKDISKETGIPEGTISHYSPNTKNHYEFIEATKGIISPPKPLGELVKEGVDALIKENESLRAENIKLTSLITSWQKIAGGLNDELLEVVRGNK